jgi:hypothetical protein
LRRDAYADLVDGERDGGHAGEGADPSEEAHVRERVSLRSSWKPSSAQILAEIQKQTYISS